MYERFSVLHSMDTCYKVIWALNAEYGVDTYPSGTPYKKHYIKCHLHLIIPNIINIFYFVSETNNNVTVDYS